MTDQTLPYNSVKREELRHEAARNRRTIALLARMRGLKDEFAMLKGVLCMSHNQSIEDSRLIEDCFDNLLIASRLDAMNREFLASTATVQQPPLRG